MDTLLIVDPQYGFINQNTVGALNEIKKVVSEKDWDIIISTQFINNKDSLYRDFGYESMDISDSYNIKIHKDIENKSDLIIKKYGYGYSKELINYLHDYCIKRVFICGFDTESCVLSTAISLFDHGIKPVIIEKCCSSSRGKRISENAFEIMRIMFG